MTHFILHGPFRFVPRLLAIVGLWFLAADNAHAAEANGPATYAEQREFLSRHTQVLELSDGRGARVAICPQWQGRVMTSTSGGLSGPSFGWINRQFITDGKPSAAFNNYGGEDRFWISPEGGPFALWFAPGVEQTLANWITPPDLNEGPFKVASSESTPSYRMTRRVRLANYAKTPFDLEVAREIRLQSADVFAQLFGEKAAAALADKRLRMVGFSSTNTITNRGPAMKRDNGLVSIWILGQFPAGDQTVIVVPYRSGDEKMVGPVVTSDYFGAAPPERLRVTPGAILFRGDGKFRAKIGTSPRRATPFAGSIDLRNGVLTLVHFSMPRQPAAALYVNNTWKLHQAEPFAGDVFNSYNDGPPEPGAKAQGSFYELETLSPAVEMGTGTSIMHEHHTFHVHGDLAALAPLVKTALGVDLEEIRKMVEP